MTNLPIYEALICDETDGIEFVSIVDEPATEVDYMLFSKDKVNQKFSITNEEKHLLSSVIMVCDTPIYRRNQDGYEYYIKYSADTIRKMAQKMLSDNTFNNIDLNHTEHALEKGKIELVELYIKDEEKGINPNFIDVPNGSLMCTYKIQDEELWEALKSENFNGLSLSGLFTVQEANAFSKVEDEEEKEILDLISKLKDKINKSK